MTQTNAAGTLSRKSVRTVRRSLISHARKPWRSCWRRRPKVQRSLFRKVPSSWKPDIHSRSTIQSRSQEHLRKPCPEAGLDMLGAMGRMTRKANALLQARVSRNVNEATESKLSLLDRSADVIAAFSGSMAFLILNGVWFVVWIAMNFVPMPWFEPFDPFPFGLLTMIVSLEAIFLSCFVLISQARQ